VQVNEESYLNPYGQAMERKLADAIDSYIFGDAISRGIEVYSFVTPIRKEIASDEYLMQAYEYNLNDYAWNAMREEGQKCRQTVLTYEDSSKWRKIS